jgi:hypothetical protein
LVYGAERLVRSADGEAIALVLRADRGFGSFINHVCDQGNVVYLRARDEARTLSGPGFALNTQSRLTADRD